MSKNIELSIIIPYSQPGRYDPVQELYYSYKRIIESTGFKYEFIYVINGNYDDFQKVLKELCQLKDAGEKIKVIKLARWFGEGTALSIGFEHSIGAIILTLPPYEQIDFNDIPTLIQSLQNHDMVVGRRWPRIDSYINQIQSKIFHYMISYRGDSRFNDLGCNVRVFKRKILEKVYIYGEQHRFLPILAHRYGFKILEVNVCQTQRDAFQRIYPLGVYLRRFIDLISVFFLVKFIKKPLRFFGITGLFSCFLGSLLATYLFVERIFFHIPLADRPLLLFDLLLFVLGIQLLAIGLIGEIIIFTHAKELKDYTIEKIIN